MRFGARWNPSHFLSGLAENNTYGISFTPKMVSLKRFKPKNSGSEEFNKTLNLLIKARRFQRMATVPFPPLFYPRLKGHLGTGAPSQGSGREPRVNLFPNRKTVCPDPQNSLSKNQIHRFCTTTRGSFSQSQPSGMGIHAWIGAWRGFCSSETPRSLITFFHFSTSLFKW